MMQLSSREAILRSRVSKRDRIKGQGCRKGYGYGHRSHSELGDGESQEIHGRYQSCGQGYQQMLGSNVMHKLSVSSSQKSGVMLRFIDQIRDYSSGVTVRP